MCLYLSTLAFKRRCTRCCIFWRKCETSSNEANSRGPPGNAKPKNPDISGILIHVEPPPECESYLCKIRFCNHQEFLQVFNLYGIEVLRIDGNMPFAKRQTVVDAFHTKGSPRVLIFSSVGTAGLNLSIADVVILLVHCLDFNFYMSLILGIGSTLECTGRAPNHRPCPPSTSKK